MNDYRILVVDDEEDLCEILKIQFRKRRVFCGHGKLRRRSPEDGTDPIQLAVAGCDDGRNIRIQNGEHAEKE